MNNLSQYFIYFIIYGYILLSFLKGYYPANETGILFIGFLIFMSLAYKFAGSLISDELNFRRQDIYNKFEDLMEQNYISISQLRSIYLDIISQKNGVHSKLIVLFAELEEDLHKNFESGLLSNLNYTIILQLQSSLKYWLSLLNSNIEIAYSLAVKQLLVNKIDSDINS